jgi:hypothetical protein
LCLRHIILKQVFFFFFETGFPDPLNKPDFTRGCRETGNTGGPRNSRTFYLRIRLFAIAKNVPKLTIRGLLVIAPSLIRGFGMKIGSKLH